MKQYLVWVVCVVASAAACGQSAAPAASHQDASSSVPPTTKVEAGADASVLAIPVSCAGQLQPPSTLECTGLYTDIATGTLAPQVRSYAPAVPLWADGSGKSRWIYLPPGQKIDNSDPSEWTFPVGTRIWKEFDRDGVRVETRFFEKVAPGTWNYGTYQWNAAATQATLSAGLDFTLPDGETYHIPTTGECEQCHGGRSDRVMGFEQVSLGLTGASGITLADLVNEGLLTNPPATTHLTIGNDGTGMAAAPLSWLHINCGVSCHNTNPNATAYGAGMVLRLDPTALNGQPSNEFPSEATTIGVAATSSFAGRTIIAPGNPGDSLLYQLIDERGAVQMPPIASLYVDTSDVAVVKAWIAAMPHAPFDAGSDSGFDASHLDATSHDGSSPDAPTHEAAVDAPYHEAAADAGERDGAVDGGVHEGDASEEAGDASSDGKG